MDPSTVRVNPASPAVSLEGDRLVVAGTGTGFTVKT